MAPKLGSTALPRGQSVEQMELTSRLPVTELSGWSELRRTMVLRLAHEAASQFRTLSRLAWTEQVETAEGLRLALGTEEARRALHQLDSAVIITLTAQATRLEGV